MYRIRECITSRNVFAKIKAQECVGVYTKTDACKLKLIIAISHKCHINELIEKVSEKYQKFQKISEISENSLH